MNEVIYVIKNYLGGSRFLEQNRGTITQTVGCIFNNQRFDFKIYKNF